MAARPHAIRLRSNRSWLRTGLLLLAAWGQAAAADNGSSPQRFTRQQIDFYEQQALPILTENCYRCHSHQADKIKGEFLLDSRAALLKGGATGPAAVPGEPEKSLLIKAVRQLDEDLQMPPRKKLTDEQITVLADWIKMGAPYSETDAAHAAKTGNRKITEADRKWWSFQPVRHVNVPEVQDGGWSRNPVDKFIFAKLTAAGLAPAPEADRRTFMRRAYYDVLGLLPSAEEVERYVADDSPGAYERMINTLLDDPRYGEKWARHWLDLVRYAESDGYKSDGFRPTAWRYRDYVIRSLNEDKPYDRFMMEQLAADELWPNEPEALAGLGYLRLWIYEYNQRNVKGQWATILNDITDVTSDAFLGLGLQCARCHDHKFDPLLQRDYYRMQAFFAALSPRDQAPLVTAETAVEYRAQLARWEEKTVELRAQIDTLERPVRDKTAKAAIDKFPRDIQELIYKSAEQRTPYEQQLRDLAYRQVTEEEEKLDGKFRGAEKQKLDALEQELANYDSLKPKPLPEAMLVTDIGSTAPPVILPKDKSQTPIEPGFPTVLHEGPAKIEAVVGPRNSTGRRAALAKWLVAPDNPLTSRVMVNRIWQAHFGRGLVATSSDFGHLGEAPTHPELLDWLAGYFVEHHWSAKELHRLILTSATYRQSAVVAADRAGKAGMVDAGNRWLWRQNARRLESDEIRDTMLSVSGELDAKRGGPSVEATKPRRTIYTKWLRNSRDPLLDAFDPPDPYSSTPQRNVTTTPMQSLVMLNGPYVLQRAGALARRLQNLHLPQDDLVTAAYRLVYGRKPSASEQSNGLTFLSEQARLIAKSDVNLAQVTVRPMPGRAGTAADFKPEGGQTRLQVPDNHLMPQYDFTIEAFVTLHSSDKGGALRTMVSRWDGRHNQPGWSFGVAGKKSDYPAHSLVLELVGDPAEDGIGGYEAIASGLTIELDKPYYVAVSVRIGDTSESGVTFYSQELAPGASLQTAHVPHRVTANHQSNLPLLIGARSPEEHLVWDGLIDDVRLTGRALKVGELLPNHEASVEGTVGYWRFEEPDCLKDASPNGHHIRAEVSPSAQSSPATAALIDFCHVLLNSNEFLYVD